jgi:transcriptional regulator with XRE-family HTH domain
MKATSERMVDLRKGINISQVRLSKELGISQSAINRYEHNASSIPDNVLLKYAEFFNVSADYILGRTDKPEGAIYSNEPVLLKQKMLRDDEWMEFVEACFDPRSPMNKKLKEIMMQMAGGGYNADE